MTQDEPTTASLEAQAEPVSWATSLAQKLVGPDLAVSNATFSGADGASATFSGWSDVLGFGSGVILSTGYAGNVVGPNEYDSISANNNTPGDPALSAIAGQDTYDAAVLDFDIVPRRSPISFQYVFSSEEYNEFVGGSYDDVVAVFVNGTNCALLPRTSVPVTVDTVNLGSQPGLFRNNELPNATINTEMDGLTTVLTCTVGVNVGVANHVRVGIADATDAWYDSNVFLKGATVDGGPVAAGEVLGGATGRSVRNLPCAVGQATDYPVTTSTGNFWHTFADMAVPGRGIPLLLARTYNSAMAAVGGPFGYGWTFSYGVSVSTDEGSGTATVHQEDGSQVSFTLSNGVYLPPPRADVTLQKDSPSLGMWTFLRGARETLTFDTAGKLVSFKDLNGYVTTVARPDSATMVVTDPAGRSLSFTFTGSRVTKVADSSSVPRTVEFSYDGSGDLVDVKDVGGGHTKFTYDSHRLLTMREPKYATDTSTTPAPVITNRYDAQGRIEWQTDQLGRKTSFFYDDPEPGATRIVDPNGNFTVDRYSQGVLVSKTAGYGTTEAATTTRNYDPTTLGCTSIIDPNGNTRTAAYDAAGNRTRETDPLHRTTTATYNSLNLVTKETDAAGVATSYAYDAAGNLLSESRPLLNPDGTVGATRTVTYNYGGTTPVYAGDVTSMVDPNGHRWEYRYDAFGNLIKSTAPPTPSVGNTTTYGYDTAKGWRTSMVAPKGNVSGAEPGSYITTYDYDAFGRLTVTKDPLWTSAAATRHRTERHYDLNGNLDYVIDADNNKTTYVYDAANQLDRTTRADGSITDRDYWPDGSLKLERDASGQATTYGYDSLARLTTTTDPLGRTTNFGYDPVGNVKTKQDHGGNCASNPKSGCTTYGYDVANQVTGIDYADPATPDVTVIAYDANSRRTSMTDGTGTSTWAWDSLGRMNQSKQGSGATVGYGYDLVGNATSIAYPGTGTVTRHFDAAGRMDWVQDWLGNRTTFGYDQNSNLTTQALPGTAAVTDTFGFDAADQLDSIGVAKLTGPLASFSYTRTAAGLVSGVNSDGVPADDRAFGYNALNQLCWSAGGGTGTCAEPPAGPKSYDYDDADNLVQQASTSYAHDAANQLCSAGSPAGTCAAPHPQATAFEHDTRGNRTAAGHAHGAVAHTYDAANRLTATTTGLGGVNFGTDGDEPVPADYDGDGDDDVAVLRPGSQSTWFVRSGETIPWGTNGDEPVPADYDGDGDDDVAVFRPSVGTWYIHGGQSVAFGTAGDIPVPADYDGDGDDDIAVYRPSVGVWFVRGATPEATAWGTSGDIPVAADYDGDGRDDIAVWRPSNGTWYVINSAGGVSAVGWGTNGDLPAPGDYDGDAKADRAVWRFSDGTWYLINSRGGQTHVSWGTTGDIPVTADYDGDLRADMAVFRPSSGAWYPRTARVGTTNYAYDGDGLRASKDASGTTTGFVWDVSGGLPMLLAEQSAGATTSYIYGPKGLPLARVDSSGSVVYYHHDQLGSTRLLTDATGKAVASYTYDDYGRLKASTGSVIQPFGFAGEYTDAETGFQYLRARYYDPATGNFLTRDPLEAETREPYGYVGGDPLNNVDPSGMHPCGAVEQIGRGMSVNRSSRHCGLSPEQERQFLERERKAAEQAECDRREAEARARALAASAKVIPHTRGFVGFITPEILSLGYAAVGCWAVAPHGAQAGRATGQAAGPTGAAVGAGAGWLAGCAAGAADAYWTSSPVPTRR